MEASSLQELNHGEVFFKVDAPRNASGRVVRAMVNVGKTIRSSKWGLGGVVEPGPE